MLVSEIEVKQSKMDECQKYSEQYSAAVKVRKVTWGKFSVYVCRAVVFFFKAIQRISSRVKEHLNPFQTSFKPFYI